MGEYAAQHGVAAAAWHFARQFNYQVTELTVDSIKKAYLEEVELRENSMMRQLRVCFQEVWEA